MNPQVADYLARFEAKKNEQDADYRFNVLKAAGLVNKTTEECSREVYYRVPPDMCVVSEEIDGVVHYYITKEEPVEVTDEEFAAIEKTILTEKKEMPSDESSGSATFFTVLAWILWIGGFIVSLIMANQEVQHVATNNYGITKISTTTEFSFTVFTSTFAIYIISGALCMAASELFKKLQTIVNLLRARK